ncbi:head-tail connector protein [Nonomuraea wenchangensis]|uniref:Phage gp6-like head-tail connector protein n=1 Tax=Nonomuraea wenchangensis TaxID=568860 RepID=A0A1I0EEI5_9ACTN|nr:phage head-tail connector protein [Nonomuraea wenchangensis]SET43384.1 Phage gp6-like head-tail connector protein [Nonomuraea wenchangensis]
MALGDTYATLEELKAYMSIDKPTLSLNDDLLEEALESASREIDRHCERQFNKADVVSTRIYRPKGCKLVTVDDFYSTEGLVIATDSGDTGSFNTVWSETQYELEPLNGIVNGEFGWPYFRIRAVGSAAFPVTHDRASLQITALWGWSAVPAPVKRATLVIASETAKLKDSPFGVAGYGEFGPVRVKNSPVAMRMLAPYRLRPVKVG